MNSEAELADMNFSDRSSIAIPALHGEQFMAASILLEGGYRLPRLMAAAFGIRSIGIAGRCPQRTGVNKQRQRRSIYTMTTRMTKPK